MFLRWLPVMSGLLTRPKRGYGTVSRDNGFRREDLGDAPIPSSNPESTTAVNRERIDRNHHGLSRIRTVGSALAVRIGLWPTVRPSHRTFTASYESAPCPDLQAANLGPEFSCGLLVVPENRDRDLIVIDQRGTLSSQPAPPATRSASSPARRWGCRSRHRHGAWSSTATPWPIWWCPPP